MKVKLYNLFRKIFMMLEFILTDMFSKFRSKKDFSIEKNLSIINQTYLINFLLNTLFRSMYLLDLIIIPIDEMH
jgi:hypothetical protein